MYYAWHREGSEVILLSRHCAFNAAKNAARRAVRKIEQPCFVFEVWNYPDSNDDEQYPVELDLGTVKDSRIKERILRRRHLFEIYPPTGAAASL